MAKASVQKKATFNQTALDIVIRTVDIFNTVLLEMTEHALTAYTFREQKRYMRRHLMIPSDMKLCSFTSRLHELSAYLSELPSDTEGQEIAPYSADEIMDII